MRIVVASLLCLAGCDLVFELKDPTTPGTCDREDCLTVLAKGQTGATEVVSDGTDVFWATDAVRGCAIAACQPVTLDVPNNPPHNLVLESRFVLYAGGNQMFGTARDGTGVTQSWHDDSNMDVDSFVRLGTRIFWTAGDQGLTRCEYAPSIPACTNPTSVPLQFIEGPLAADLGGRLWAVSLTDVVQFDLDRAERVRGFPANSPQLIATGATHVFAIEDSQVLAWPLTAPEGADATLLFETPAPLGIATDDEYLYVLDAGGSILRVSQMALDSEPEPILSGVPGLRAFAVTSDLIVVVAGDRIAALPKP